MFLRDKSVSAVKENSLSFLDIRQKEDYHEQRVFKSEWFDLSGFVEKLDRSDTESQRSI